jgi:hypothetical protein
MQDLTVYLLKDFFESTLSLQSNVTNVVFNSPNSTITVCNIFNLRAGSIVLIDSVEYTVISVNHSAESFTVLGDLTGAIQITLVNPFFLWGTPIQANTELSYKRVDKYPFIYLKEIIRETVFNEKAALNREATISLFFLDEMNKSDYHTREFYSEVIIGLNKLVNEAIRQLRLDISNFYLVNTDFNLTNHSDFGLNIINTKGHVKALFSDNLSAVELSVTLPIKKGCKCCLNKPNQKNYMFQKYQFSTSVGETTKVLDFIALGIFPTRNKSFISELQKDEGLTWSKVAVGEGITTTGTTDGGENINVVSQAATLSINESDNIFSFAGLTENTNYQICIFQG